MWVGSRALTTAETEEVPDPLVIFGYASLMFRPQESFAHVKRFGGWVKGWRRVWAQRYVRGSSHFTIVYLSVCSKPDWPEDLTCCHAMAWSVGFWKRL